MEKKEINAPHNFKPRSYQVPLYNSLARGYKRIEVVWHRRAGKDKTMVSMLAKEALKRVGAYYYVFPTYKQGKKILWDGKDGDGFRILKHIPEQIWDSENSTDLSITLKNGSKVQIMGSDQPDALVGTNPVGIIFSEWSLQDPQVWGLMRPILEENGGWAMFNYTPRGDNHAKSFHEQVKADSEWFSSFLTVEDTGVIPQDRLEKIKTDYMQEYGDDALFYQEYYCSFESPVQGAVYAKQMRNAQDDNRVGNYPYDPLKMVETFWDLGTRDTTAVIFAQRADDGYVNIIDHYEASGAGMGALAEMIIAKGYSYSGHYLPHDADQNIQGEKVETRKQILQRLLPNQKIHVSGRKGVPIMGKRDGMDKTRVFLSKCRFNAATTGRLIKALKEYAYKWDENNRTWSAEPKHDWASHSADAMRILATTYKERPTRANPNKLYDPALDFRNSQWRRKR